MNTTFEPTREAPAGRPRPGWRQAGRDALYLLPGLPIAIASFTILMTAFWLGVGLIVLAFLGFVILLATLAVARGFAAAERSRVRLMEGRHVGPAYYRHPAGSGMSRVFGYLRDAQLWRDFGHGLLILPVRVFTWSLTITWVSASLMITYVLWAWAIPQGDEAQGLAELVLGWEGLAADVVVNTALSIIFLVTLPYVLRALAVVESALAWTMLTNENTAWRARAEELGRSRQAVVQAEADTLRRVERDIHDGPQQRLVRLTMDLKSAQRRLSDDPEAAGPLMEGALQQTEEALAELRALSRGIAPPILTDRGLQAALAAAAARCPIPTTLDIRLDSKQRLPSSVENAAYFVVAESLTNAAKHSDATHCVVSALVESAGAGPHAGGDGGLRLDDSQATPTPHAAGSWQHPGDLLKVQVVDDGRGGAHVGKGHGLAGLTDRLSGVDGQLSVDSPAGGGTAITATIPVHS